MEELMRENAELKKEKKARDLEEKKTKGKKGGSPIRR